MHISLYNALEESIYSADKDLTKFNFMSFMKEAQKSGVDMGEVDIAYTIHRINSDSGLKIERIMLVEDDDLQRKNASFILGRLGHYIESFESAEDALAFYRKDPSRFSVVFTDNNMKQMSGSQLAKEIKKLSTKLRVYVITGDISSVDEDLFDANVEATINKPVSSTVFEFSIGTAYGSLSLEASPDSEEAA